MEAHKKVGHGLSERRRWVALYVLCLSVLMIVLDTTIVTVALPSIEADLHFSRSALIWVLNAYTLSFGGLLLLGGRLGDLYGQRRLFLTGIGLFTLASLACGSAHGQATLVTARAVQGVGGAVVAAIGLSLILNLFVDADERAKAMGIYGFVCAAGGSIGALLGGVLTKTLGWHSIFLVNLPIGIAVYIACMRLLERDTVAVGTRRLDVAGALTVTTGMLLAVYAVMNGNEAGWLALRTVATLAAALALLALFVGIERRVREPLMPLRLLRSRNIATANVLSVLWAAGMFAWFVIATLYLQRVLGYDPLHVGLAFLPADLIMAAFSAGLSARMVMRYGIRRPLWWGLTLGTAGLALFARAPTTGNFVVDVLPGMLLLGLGAGMAFNPMLLAAMNDVESHESGLASGIVNTAFMMGGALGLAALASSADALTAARQQAGFALGRALNDGYHLAFSLGAALTGCAALLGAALLRQPALLREPRSDQCA